MYCIIKRIPYKCTCILIKIIKFFRLDHKWGMAQDSNRSSGHKEIRKEYFALIFVSSQLNNMLCFSSNHYSYRNQSWRNIENYQLWIPSPLFYIKYMSRVMRKSDFCICKNKEADQMCSNCATDQRLCFRYIESAIPLLPKSKISSL